MDRRDFIKLGGLGALASAGLVVPLTGVSAKAASTLLDKDFPKPYTRAFVRPRVLRPYGTKVVDDQVVQLYCVTAQEKAVNILPTLRTPVCGYDGQVPGPIISVDQKHPISLRVRNQLTSATELPESPFELSTHLHGSASLPQYDGYASDLTRPGHSKDYEYPNFQDARTLWYHDHGVHYTSQNVYAGLAAQYHLHDDLERAQLPQGVYDVPIVLSDAMFAADGRLGFDDKDHSGLWGDVVLVNGVPWPTMKVQRAVYRFRVLNASISRSYRLALSTGQPLTVVATDGGMVPTPIPVGNYRQGPAERYELLIDFRQYAPGRLVDLVNRSNPNNVDYTHTGKVMRFQVLDETPTVPFEIPTSLTIGSHGVDTMGLRDVAPSARRNLRVHRDDRTNVWLLNGETWEDVKASGFTDVFSRPDIHAVEQWTIENRGGGWFHPLHVHLVDFLVVGRNTNGGKPFPWERGPKDVVYVGEGETVRLLMRFDVSEGSSGGRYMIHCHNLPHEDHDMMIQYQVGRNDPRNDPNDPITAAPAVPDTGEPTGTRRYEAPVVPEGSGR